MKGKILKPTPSISVTVEIVDTEDSCQFPVATCESCVQKLKDSGLIEAIKVVKWMYVHTNMYDMEQEVSDSC